MLTASAASLADAVRELDRAERALLSLSLRRGVADDVIAEIARSDAAGVARERAVVLARLAVVSGLRPDEVAAELAELPGEAWGEPPAASAAPAGDGEPRAPVAPPTKAASAAPSRSAAPAPARGRRPRGALLATVAALAAAAAVAGVVLVTGDGSGGGAPAGRSPDRAAAPPAAAPEPAATARFEPVGAATGVRGELRVTSDRLGVDVRGLPPLAPGERYAVWLYDSVTDARPLASGRGTRIALELERPGALDRYAAVDVSREAADGNANHSGASVARAVLPR